MSKITICQNCNKLILDKCTRFCSSKCWGQFYGKINRGVKLTKEHKIKIGLFKKNRSYEEIYGIEKARIIKDKMSKSHIEQYPSRESLEKRRQSMLNIMTPERKEMISKHLTGRKVSEETKKKLSLANKNNPLLSIGRPHTEEAKEKLRKANLGKKQSLESKEKIRLARAKQIFPIKDTKIEIKIQNFLKQLKIDYETHRYMGDIEHYYQCDVFIPSLNMVIECDGDYWHGNPEKYLLQELTLIQMKQQKMDKIRTKELQDKGYKIVRLWEDEIKSLSIDNFKNKLMVEK